MSKETESSKKCPAKSKTFKNLSKNLGNLKNIRIENRARHTVYFISVFYTTFSSLTSKKINQ